jgi:Zn-dependent protease with chaperone function
MNLRWLRPRPKQVPFDSSEFDVLAERMGALPFMEKDTHRRYFKTNWNVLAASKGKTMLFGAHLYDMMTQDQRTAVAAHELAHIRERDISYTRRHLLLPPVLAWVALSALFFPFFLQDLLDFTLLVILGALLAFYYAPLLLKLATARRYRAIELRCDEIAARYADGETLISALYMADQILNPPKLRKSRRYRLLSRLYPKMEERAEAIRRVSGTTGF